MLAPLDVADPLDATSEAAAVARLEARWPEGAALFVETDDAPASTRFGVRVRIFGAPEDNAPRASTCAAFR